MKRKTIAGKTIAGILLCALCGAQTLPASVYAKEADSYLTEEDAGDFGADDVSDAVDADGAGGASGSGNFQMLEKPVAVQTYEEDGNQVRVYGGFTQVGEDGAQTLLENSRLILKRGSMIPVSSQMEYLNGRVDQIVVDTISGEGGDVQYLSILGEDHMVHDYYTALKWPEELQNAGIEEISNTLDTGDTVLVVRYMDNTVGAFNYLTGTLIYYDQSERQSIGFLEYVGNWLAQTRAGLLGKTADGYASIRLLEQELTVRPLDQASLGTLLGTGTGMPEDGSGLTDESWAETEGGEGAGASEAQAPAGKYDAADASGDSADESAADAEGGLPNKNGGSGLSGDGAESAGTDNAAGLNGNETAGGPGAGRDTVSGGTASESGDAAGEGTASGGADVSGSGDETGEETADGSLSGDSAEGTGAGKDAASGGTAAESGDVSGERTASGAETVSDSGDGSGEDNATGSGASEAAGGSGEGPESLGTTPGPADGTASAIEGAGADTDGEAAADGASTASNEASGEEEASAGVPGEKDADAADAAAQSDAGEAVRTASAGQYLTFYNPETGDYELYSTSDYLSQSTEGGPLMSENEKMEYLSANGYTVSQTSSSVLLAAENSGMRYLYIMFGVIVLLLAVLLAIRSRTAGTKDEQ